MTTESEMQRAVRRLDARYGATGWRVEGLQYFGNPVFCAVPRASRKLVGLDVLLADTARDAILAAAEALETTEAP